MKGPVAAPSYLFLDAERPEVRERIPRLACAALAPVAAVTELYMADRKVVIGPADEAAEGRLVDYALDLILADVAIVWVDGRHNQRDGQRARENDDDAERHEPAHAPRVEA